MDPGGIKAPSAWAWACTSNDESASFCAILLDYIRARRITRAIEIYGLRRKTDSFVLKAKTQQHISIECTLLLRGDRLRLLYFFMITFPSSMEMDNLELQNVSYPPSEFITRLSDAHRDGKVYYKYYNWSINFRIAELFSRILREMFEIIIWAIQFHNKHFIYSF